MWLYSAVGFLSAAMSGDPDTVVVGARVRRDLQRLQQLVVFLGHFRPEISENAWADYQFQVRLSRSAYVEALAALVTAIDYENFIWAVEEVQGEQRALAYRKLALITHTLTEVEDGG